MLESVVLLKCITLIDLLEVLQPTITNEDIPEVESEEDTFIGYLETLEVEDYVKLVKILEILNSINQIDYNVVEKHCNLIRDYLNSLEE